MCNFSHKGRGENKSEEIFEETMVDSFHKLMRDIKPHVQEF